jgi:hypothetical protein
VSALPSTALFPDLITDVLGAARSDFEFASINARGFDIGASDQPNSLHLKAIIVTPFSAGNHFCEWVGIASHAVSRNFYPFTYHVGA